MFNLENPTPATIEALTEKKPFYKKIVKPEVLGYLGPAFLVSVGYMDPGNWGTDIQGGSDFGYKLLWVLLLSNLMAILLQTLSAKLGIVTGKSLAENCREYFSRPVSLILWVLSELAMMATDLAEFLGAALGFYILFNIPMFSAALITGVVVFGILWFYRLGYRAVEYIIIGLVLTIGFCYVIEILLAKPVWGEIGRHVIIPQIDSRSILVAVGMLGATVMPHNLFLHSGVIRYRLKNNNGVTHKKLFKFAIIDSIFALNGAWLVNSAIIIMSAAVFFKNGLAVSTITEAHKTLTPLLGGLSSMAFAIALLASGLSSSTTGTLAGQIVIEGFLKIKISLFLRRLVTMIPALIVIYIGVNELKILVLSQVFLSLALPFVTIPLIIFTWKKKIMGEYANRPLTNLLAIITASIIIFLNLLLLFQVFGGSF